MGSHTFVYFDIVNGFVYNIYLIKECLYIGISIEWSLTYFVAYIWLYTQSFLSFLQVGSPIWCPTKITTPSGSYEFPLKEDGGYNYYNCAGFQYEAAAVRNALNSGENRAQASISVSL